MTFCQTGTKRVGYKKVFDYARSKDVRGCSDGTAGGHSAPLAGEEADRGLGRGDGTRSTVWLERKHARPLSLHAALPTPAMKAPRRERSTSGTSGDIYLE